jgi:hypothetical protein
LFEKIHHDTKASSPSDHDPRSSKKLIYPQDQQKRRSLLETKSESQMTKKTIRNLESTKSDALKGSQPNFQHE